MPMSYIYGMPYIYSKLAKPKTSEVYNTYWKFAAERQKVFFNKLHGIHPLTNDRVLKQYKFTNAYRAADRVSQYLIKEVIYSDNFSNNDLFYRIILFKLFNKIETWRFIERSVGSIDWARYSFNEISSLLGELIMLKKPVYSGAYIMASGKSFFGFEKKFQNHLRLIELMMKEDLPQRISSSNSLEEVYLLLRGYPTLGKFLAFQFAIDLNYSPLINFSEMDFVVAGPGAVDGINKCFIEKGDFSNEDIIKWVTEKQEPEFERLGIEFQSLWGRPLQLIDCQNLFCEVDKYSRVIHPEVNGISGRHRIKQKYSPSEERISNYMFPPKWGINENFDRNG